MTRHVSSEKARANWREILDAVAGGETIIVERYGWPVATLAPYHSEGAVREPAVVYNTDTLEQLKAEIVSRVLAELEANLLEPLPWLEGLAEIQRLERESGSPFAGMTTEEIVERMRETRREITEAEYAHLYR
jgi:antitoxin (DNA-binding transcriptional repressor) of toxin-antitoxin stability system